MSTITLLGEVGSIERVELWTVDPWGDESKVRNLNEVNGGYSFTEKGNVFIVLVVDIWGESVSLITTSSPNLDFIRSGTNFKSGLIIEDVVCDVGVNLDVAPKTVNFTIVGDVGKISSIVLRADLTAGGDPWGDPEFKVEDVDYSSGSFTCELNDNYFLTVDWADVENPLQLILVDGFTDPSNTFSFSKVKPYHKWLTSSKFKLLGGSEDLTLKLIYEGSESEIILSTNPYTASFIMSDSNLVDFANSDIKIGGMETSEKLTKSQYISSLYQIPFKLEDDLYPTSKDIVLGGTNFNINAPVLLNDLIEVDLGSIEVGTLEGSSLDYLENKFELFTPFSTSAIELKPSLIIGKVINVKYTVNVFDGDTTLNVYCEGELISSSKTTIGRNLPYKVLEYINSSINSNSGLNNGVLRAYIKHTRPELLLGTFNNLVEVNGTLLDVTGYAKVNNIQLDLKAVGYEKDELVSILQQGIVIK